MRAKVPGAMLVAWAVVAAGCVEDDRYFVIVQNQVPTAGCVVPTSEGIYRDQGTLDLLPAASGLVYGYTMFPLVENNMGTSAGDNQPERNTLHMSRFEVQLDMSNFPGTFPEGLTNFSAAVSSAAIRPGALRSFSVEVIPRALVRDHLQNAFPPQVTPQVLVSLTAVGTRAGDEKESNTFIFPVTLCQGCLVDLRDLTSCAEDEDVYTNECGTPQDSQVTCCTGADNQVDYCLSQQ